MLSRFAEYPSGLGLHTLFEGQADLRTERNNQSNHLYISANNLQKMFRYLSSPNFMYHFDVRFLGLADACSGTDVALCDCTV